MKHLYLFIGLVNAFYILILIAPLKCILHDEIIPYFHKLYRTDMTLPLLQLCHLFGRRHSLTSLGMTGLMTDISEN